MYEGKNFIYLKSHEIENNYKSNGTATQKTSATYQLILKTCKM
jgi:hypothetical protein